MKYLETSQTLNRADISEIEKELSIVFPDDFVAHYLRYNGGYPESDAYKWRDEGATTVNAFLSLKYNGFGNLENTYKNLALLERYFPLGIVPFALDDGGNLFCISVRENNFGKVYYFNNNHYDAGDEESALTFLENTFTNFIETLSGRVK